MQAVLGALIYLAAFIAAMLAVHAISQFLFETSDTKNRMNRRLTLLASGMDPKEVYHTLVRRRPGKSQLSFLPFYDRLSRECRQAGIEADPYQILVWVACGTVLLWLLTSFMAHAGSLTGAFVNGVVTLIASATICGMTAWLWIRRQKTKRMRLLEEQLPLALDVINRALRAGHPVISAVQLAGNELGDPIGTEFGLVIDETTYGEEFRQALVNFAHRTGSQDAHFFAVSIAIQTDTGGNLAEILEGLATVIRGRATLAKRVKALSSEGRASALLLSILPILMISFVMLTHPEMYVGKFGDPIFWPSASVIGVLYLLGWYMIHRIINFRY
jgi:tight adherence protein B